MDLFGTFFSTLVLLLGHLLLFVGLRQIAGGRWWWMGQTPLQERTVGTEWSHPVNRPVQLFQLLSLCVLLLVVLQTQNRPLITNTKDKHKRACTRAVIPTLIWGQQTQTHNQHEHKTKTTIALNWPVIIRLLSLCILFLVLQK